MNLPTHNLKIVLVEPEIPQNAGNVARLCAVIGAELHLVRPLGFFLSGRHLKRAGMDYLDRITLVVHDDLPTFRQTLAGQRYHLASAHGLNSYWDMAYEPSDWLIFGRESAGLPTPWLQQEPDKTVRIPMKPDERCLNLATSVGIFSFEVLRQLHYK